MVLQVPVLPEIWFLCSVLLVGEKIFELIVYKY